MNGRWSGWVSFAAWLMVVIGGLDFFEGLIAVIRDKYYVLAPNQIIVFDLTTWGWVTLVWGLVVAFAGWSLLSRASWARRASAAGPYASGGAGCWARWPSMVRGPGCWSGRWVTS